MNPWTFIPASPIPFPSSLSSPVLDLSCSSKSLENIFSSTGNDSFPRPNHNQNLHKENTNQSNRIVKTENRTEFDKSDFWGIPILVIFSETY